MASNQTAIYNMAIGMVGGTRCTGPADVNVVEVLILNEVWPVAVDDVIAGRDWSFARKVALLVPVPDPLTLLGQNRACFAVPNDSAAVRQISDSLDFDPDNAYEWEIQEQIIIIDSSPGAVLWARYTKTLRDPAFFDGPFVACLVARLAAELALPITNSKSTFESLWKLYLSRLSGSATHNGMQGKRTRFARGKLSRAHGL